MLKNISILFLFSIILLNKSFAQDCGVKPSGDKRAVNDYMAMGHYPCALQELQIIYADKPKSKKVNEQIVDCYFLSPGANKSQALKYLLFLNKIDPDNTEYIFKLGRTYLYHYEFDKALEFFKKYETLAKLNNDEQAAIDKFKEYAIFSKELTKHPVNVTFTNLGEDVNSVYNDLHPFVTEDEDYIMHTTDRKGTRGIYMYGDGYARDVFITKMKNGRDEFKTSRGLPGSFNTEFTEEVAGGSADGSHFIYSSDEQFQVFNLKHTYKAPKKRSFPRAEYIESLNGRNSNEIAATITNSGDLIIFASDRKGGYGGYDLWMSRKLPNETWGEPINMGPSINTQFDEINPMFSRDENYITFASNGQKGMGGFDLFKTAFSEALKNWTAPLNLGYPVNTPHDDFTISFVKDGRYAYKSDIRPDTYGMRDLYRITFNDVLPTYTVVKSTLAGDTLVDFAKISSQISNATISMKTNLDSLIAIEADSLAIDSARKEYYATMGKLDQIDPLTNNLVEVFNASGALYGQYTPNAKTGKFIMILEPGVYDLKISNDGFEPFTKKIRIFDKSNYATELTKEYYIKPKAELLTK